MNQPIFYPAHVASRATPEELAEIIAGNSRALDCAAADLLGILIDKPGIWFATPRNATFARRVLRQVADHLRDRT